MKIYRDTSVAIALLLAFGIIGWSTIYGIRHKGHTQIVLDNNKGQVIQAFTVYPGVEPKRGMCFVLDNDYMLEPIPCPVQ